MNEEVAQRVGWRSRLIADVILRKFDDETLADMLEAGLRQAHSEGLLDAADICQSVANAIQDPGKARAAFVLASSIRELDVRNKAVPLDRFNQITPNQVGS